MSSSVSVVGVVATFKIHQRQLGKEEKKGKERKEKDEKRTVSRIPKHDSLISRTMVLQIPMIKSLRNIDRLLLNRDEDVASLVVEPLGGIVVPDVLDRVTNDLLVVEGRAGRDFSEDHDLRLGERQRAKRRKGGEGEDELNLSWRQFRRRLWTRGHP